MDDYPPEKIGSYTNTQTTATVPATSVYSTRRILSKFLCGLKSLKLEVFLFLYMFSSIARGVSLQNLIIEKSCIVHLGYPEDLCSNLTSNKSLKNEVEKMAATYNLYDNLIHMLPAAFISMFIGPWSDKYSRKIPLIIAMSGVILDDIGVIINAIYRHAPVGYILLCGIPSGLTGDFIGVITIVYSHACEMTEKNSRTLKYSLIELSTGIGMPLGSFVGGILYNSYSYIPVFEVSAIGHILALLWILFTLKETVRSENRLRTVIMDFFSLTAIKDNLKTCLKKRKNKGHINLWLMMFSMCALILTNAAFGNISYLYTYHMYNWGVMKYSNVVTVFSVAGMIAMMTAVLLLTKVWKVNDPVLGIFGTFSMMGSNICKALALSPWLYYVASTIGIFSAPAGLAIKSCLSKIAAKDELGKVFCILSCCEYLIPVASSIIFTQIFTSTLSWFAGLVYLIAAGVLILPVCAFCWQAKQQYSSQISVFSSYTTEPSESEPIINNDHDVM